MIRPLVSVVVPARNAARYLDQAVESALAQTYRPLEVIVVDDGSTDETPALAARYGSALQYLRQDHAGVSVARNRGVSAARAEYVAFLDADDEWMPRKLEVQMERLTREPEAVASFSGALRVDSRTGAETYVSPGSGEDMVAELLLHSTIVGPPSVAVVRRDAFAQTGGFDPRIAQGEDWDLWLRLAELGPFDLVDEPLARYRIHGANASRDVWRMERDNLRVLGKFFASADHRARYGHLRRRAYGNHYLLFSGSYWRAGDVRACLRCLLLAVAHRPAAIAHALGLPVRALRRRLARSAAAR